MPASKRTSPEPRDTVFFVQRLILLLALVACTDTEPEPPGPPWTERACLPDGRRRLEASAVGVGTKLVVVGGFDAPTLTISQEVLQYDPFTDKWIKLAADAPKALTHAALASIGGTIYLLGGLEGPTFVPSGTAYRLRPQATEWEPIADLPAGEERGAAAVVVSEGHIFLLGGETTAGYTDSILDYEVATNTWSVYPVRLPTARSHAAAMREQGDGTFIVAGGQALQGPLGDTWALRLGATTWEPRAPMNTPRTGCAYGVVFGQLVCAGGEQSLAISRVVEVYDPTDDVWTISAEMPIERAGAPGAVVSSRLYVVGGSQIPMPDPTSTLYEFDLLDTLPR